MQLVTATRLPARTVATHIASRAVWAATVVAGAAALILTAPACARTLDWWSTPGAPGAVLMTSMAFGFGALVTGGLVEVARRASRDSWWSIPLLAVFSAGLGMAIWFVPWGFRNGYLESELTPACETSTPQLFVDLLLFGVWIAFSAPLFLIAIWVIGRLRRRRIHSSGRSDPALTPDASSSATAPGAPTSTNVLDMTQRESQADAGSPAASMSPTSPNDPHAEP